MGPPSWWLAESSRSAWSQNNLNTKNFVDGWLMDNKPEIYFPMLKTAEIVAQRYQVSRESQDEYALASQQRTAAGQETGKFDDEIVPITTVMDVTNKETGEVTQKEVTLSRDEGNRPTTNMEGLSALPSVTRRLDYRRQFQPVVRRGSRGGVNGSQRGREARPWSPWASTKG